VILKFELYKPVLTIPLPMLNSKWQFDLRSLLHYNIQISYDGLISAQVLLKSAAYTSKWVLMSCPRGQKIGAQTHQS